MLLPFENERYTDFSQPQNRDAVQRALAGVRGRLGDTHGILINGQWTTGSGTFVSLNPSHPSEVIGVHQSATPEQAVQAVEGAWKAFPAWSRVPAQERAATLLRAADILRRRKQEFDAWMILEAGKSWAEAEADVSEAIDFCEYYAREMVRMDTPPPPVQLPGERGVLRYLPMGVAVIIPPWNFPLAILCGMAVAALVTGNTVVIKPASDTPTIATMFIGVLLEAGFPPEAIQFLTGSGGAIGDALVDHPKTRIISFTGSREVGLRINERAARPQPGQIWIKRVIAEMGGKDAIIVDSEANLDEAARGVIASAFGFQGQKCSACSRAIVDTTIYEAFIEMLAAGARDLKIGPAEDPDNYMGPVINQKARQKILSYMDKGRGEGRVISGGGAAPGEGFFLEPTIIADIQPDSVLFRDEIFGPVLAVTKARNFEHALELANDSEYGLTGAVFSRNRRKLDAATERFHVGNLYLNRKCTGAMVGAHPFGGFNMSGTDSKAGGPDYLMQYMQAKSIAEKIA